MAYISENNSRTDLSGIPNERWKSGEHCYEGERGFEADHHEVTFDPLRGQLSESLIRVHCDRIEMLSRLSPLIWYTAQVRATISFRDIGH